MLSLPSGWTFVLLNFYTNSDGSGEKNLYRGQITNVHRHVLLISPWGRDFPPVQTGPGAHPASCKMGNGSFPGVKCGRGVLLTTHPLLLPRSQKK